MMVCDRCGQHPAFSLSLTHEQSVSLVMDLCNDCEDDIVKFAQLTVDRAGK